MQYTDIQPYLTFSRHLARKPRKGPGNMFRHQLETFTILMEYGYTEPVLLKAALIHDIVEDGKKVGFTDFDDIEKTDADGPAVMALVREVSQWLINGVKEPKKDFLLRVMEHGSDNAKILKLADRISNLTALSLAGNKQFIAAYIEETCLYILPYAKGVSEAMANELQNLINFNQSFNHE
jgi:(p)ppGpp synthase/HD superfamily hydrolase